MRRSKERKDKIEQIIDRGAARLDTLPVPVLAERIHQLAATTGWSVKKQDNGNWTLSDPDGLTRFEDTSLGSVALVIGMNADMNQKPDTVLKRYYADLFERDDLFER